MISVSNAFKSKLLNDNRNYLVEVNITLDDGTRLPIDNSNLWDGGVSFTEGTSSTSSFDIGSAIIGQCKLVLNNIYGDYDAYDFYNATLELKIGLLINDSPEMVRKGFYTVDEATYNGSLITLSCLDNMWKFDIPYDLSITFPTTAQALVLALCSRCGVSLLNSQFDKYATVIPAPSAELEKSNCREVLNYVAQMCCCFCKITTNGLLELKWYDNSSDGESYDGGIFDEDSPYSTGDELDGGSFSPWNIGDVADGGQFVDWHTKAYITSNSSMEVATDDTLITGVEVLDTDKENGYDYIYGTSDYCIIIENNPFINQTNYQSIAQQIGTKIVGMKFRTFKSSSLNDVTIEAGDKCYVKDFRGNFYKSFVTNLSFTQWNYESFECGAESVTKHKTVRYSETVSQAIKQAREDATEQITDYDLIVQRMNSLGANAMGLFTFKYNPSSGGTIIYESNRPISKTTSGEPVFALGSKVWKLTGDGFFVCTNAQTSDEDCTWVAGWDSDNNVVVNTLSAIGISFDWAKGGTLTLGGADNVNGTLVMLNASGAEFGHWKNTELQIGGSVGFNATSSQISIGDTYGLLATSSMIQLGGSSGLTLNSGGITIGDSNGYHASFTNNELALLYKTSRKISINSTSITIGTKLTITESSIVIGSSGNNVTITDSEVTIGHYGNSIRISSSAITIGEDISITSSGVNIGDSRYYHVGITGSSVFIGYGSSSNGININSSGIALGNSNSTITVGGDGGLKVTSSSITIGQSWASSKIVLSSGTAVIGSYFTLDNYGKLTLGGELEHKGSRIGFFGHSTDYQKRVDTLSSSASTSDIINKINDLLSALRAYGLISG